MCSTMHPLLRAHILSFVQVRHFGKAPICRSHQIFILSHLVTPTRISGGHKYAGLSAPAHRHKQGKWNGFGKSNFW